MILEQNYYSFCTVMPTFIMDGLCENLFVDGLKLKRNKSRFTKKFIENYDDRK